MKASCILAYTRTAASDIGMAILEENALQMLFVETCVVLTISTSFLLCLI